jgi:hypothetical protein
MRRPLGETLAEVAEAALGIARHRLAVRAQQIEVDVPVEIELGAGAAPELRADLPQWRWRTAFDRTPGRLVVVWREVARP